MAGAVYNPLDVILPTVPLPPTIPFTFQVTRVSEVPCTVAVNCRVRRTRTVTLVGDIATDTGVTPVIAMLYAAETWPSGFSTVTGTADPVVEVEPDADNCEPD